MRRGWCPTVFEPMATGDGLLVRVKPPASRLSPAQVRAVAEGAARFGNGVIDLTSRAHLQVRGLRAETVAGFAAAMVAAGLAHPDEGVERRRAVILAPGADAEMALAVEVALAEIAGLPAKFGVAIETESRRLGAVAEDVVLTVGEGWTEIRLGLQVARVASERVVSVMVGLVRAFVATGARRMREVDRAGLLRGAGLSVRAVEVPARGDFGLAGLPFGSGDAGLWAGLGAWGTVSLTPFRAVVVEGAGDLAGLGLMLEADDPRWRVAACPGAPACASATVGTRGLAARLRPRAGVTVHVSGCEKGCARRGAADWTVVGRAGRFDVVRGGAVGDRAEWVGLGEKEVLGLVGGGIA